MFPLDTGRIAAKIPAENLAEVYLMSRAYLQDVVLDGTGRPVPAASVTLLRASDYSQLPTSDPGPGSANYIRTTTTDDSGTFSFDHIPADDYHVMVQYA